jgi:hypothetical protein
VLATLPPQVQRCPPLAGVGGGSASPRGQSIGYTVRQQTTRVWKAKLKLITFGKHAKCFGHRPFHSVRTKSSLRYRLVASGNVKNKWHFHLVHNFNTICKGISIHVFPNIVLIIAKTPIFIAKIVPPSSPFDCCLRIFWYSVRFIIPRRG